MALKHLKCSSSLRREKCKLKPHCNNIFSSIKLAETEKPYNTFSERGCGETGRKLTYPGGENISEYSPYGGKRGGARTTHTTTFKYTLKVHC